jgi:BCD family chlorophyll transporter-like MFS transporter
MSRLAMSRLSSVITRQLARINLRYLPFADAAAADLPLDRLLRLSIFQISVGMATVLLIGTLNRVMIVELGMSAWIVALMISLPFLFAPLRALVGFRSDIHRSAFGWRRVPYIWLGTMLQFGGLSIMPFALLVMSGDGVGSPVYGEIGAALAFLLVGTGLHTTQTAGLALATDLAQPATRPRVVPLMYVMLMVGMIASGVAFGILLADFSPLRLIQVIQGAAVVTVALNVVALWKQEARRSVRALQSAPASFAHAWAQFAQNPRAMRFLVMVGIGTFAFNMQDIVLEPYGGQILHLTVGETTMLTALLAAGALGAFALAARVLLRGFDPYRLAACGMVAGLIAFPAVIFSAALGSPALFRTGTFFIGFGAGLFAVSTLIAAMALDAGRMNGLALGAWGAVQASAAGVGIAGGGAIRDAVVWLASHGVLGPVFTDPSVPYSVVYHLEIAGLFAALIALGPLVRRSVAIPVPSSFSLADSPR